MNIEWSEVEHMLRSFGAEVETTHHSHIKVTLGEHVRTFNKPHHKNLSSKDEIMELQHFLKEVGLAPENN